MKILRTIPASIATAILMAALSNGQAIERQITFTKDVMPILQNRCQVCHRPGTFAPMSLLTYEEARPWSKSIKQKILAREMPPWFIDKNVGIQRFSNDVSLSDQEIATIVKWVDNGSPQGNPADMPPPRQFKEANTWQIDQPDLIVTLPKDIVVPATGPDKWPDIVVDPHLTEDRYIQSVQIIPTKGFPVIHHIISTIAEPGEQFGNTGGDDGPNGPAFGEQGMFLNEYALGKAADVFPEGSGRLIKAGAKINFQIHFHPAGKETAANMALGLKFYPKGYVPKQVIASVRAASGPDLDLPPNTDNVRTDGYMTLTKATRLLSFQPHMHNRGKAACLEAIYPGGRTEMLSCARFNFNWHVNYIYDEDAAPLLPAGTTLHVISWHDNTAANKANPDPDALITWGQRTVDEMWNPWISYYYMPDEDFKKEVEARKAKQRALTSAR
jgi:hypothetical protein